MMRKILFTGITGELGRALIGPLRERKTPSVCLIRASGFAKKADLGGLGAITADIRDRDALFSYAKAMKGEIGAVVHMASARDGRSKQELHDVIVNGSVNLYEFACEIGCPEFLFFSSILAAGWVPAGLKYIDEDYKPARRRLCEFGRAKLSAEGRLLELASKTTAKVTILRPGNIYGEPKLSFIRFVFDMLKEKKGLLYNRAKNAVMWAPIYVKDVIDCVFHILDTHEFRNRIYFLTGSEYPTLEELVKMISGMAGMAPERAALSGINKAGYLFMKEADRMRAMCGRPSFPNFLYSNDRIRRDTGFVPSVKLEEGLRSTLDWAAKTGALTAKNLALELTTRGGVL